MTEIFLWAGIALAGLALAALIRRDAAHFSRRRIRVEGEVVGHRSMLDDDYTYAATIRFTGADGRRHEFTDSLYLPTRRPQAGARVALVYPEGLPGRARVSRPLRSAAAYAIVGCMLAILAARAIGWLGEGGPN